MRKFIYVAATTVFAGSTVLSTVYAAGEEVGHHNTTSRSGAANYGPVTDFEGDPTSVTVSPPPPSREGTSSKGCDWNAAYMVHNKYCDLIAKQQKAEAEKRAVWEEEKAREVVDIEQLAQKLSSSPEGSKLLSGYTIEGKTGVSLRRSESGNGLEIKAPSSPKKGVVQSPPGRRYKVLFLQTSTAENSESDGES